MGGRGKDKNKNKRTTFFGQSAGAQQTPQPVAQPTTPPEPPQQG